MLCIDVVRAYKGVLKEKEALEATVKVLSVAQEKDADSALTDEGDYSSDKEIDNEAEKSDIGDGVKSDTGDGLRSDMSEAGDSGAESRGEKKSTASLRTRLSPSGL